MKKFLLLFLLSFLSWQVKAQNTFAPVGAEWWHSFQIYGWEGGVGEALTYFTFHTESVKDTLIDGVACRKIITTSNSSTTNLGGPFYAYKKDFFFYDNTDTVFIYNENFNRFTPLYVFNAQEGDTICLPVPPTPGGHADLRLNPISGDTSFCFVVDSIRVRLYDTSHLKTFYTHALTDITPMQQASFPSYNWGPGVSYNDNPVKGQYIEHIAGDFIPTRIIKCVDCWSDTYVPFGNLRCYRDGFYDIKMDSVACDFLPLSINEAREKQMGMMIYPNPGDGKFSVEARELLAKDANVLITDISGREILTTVLPASKNKIEIQTDKFQDGIYFLTINIGQVKYYQKIIIRH